MFLTQPRARCARLSLSLLTLAAICLIAPGATAGSIPWPGWGGPARDFQVATPKLADKWPADGPQKLWSRELGQGYSAIVCDGPRLYTLYRKGTEESVVALNASDGSTAWEHKYASVPEQNQTAEFGHGPNATPLIVDDKLITVGFVGTLKCLDRATGKQLWALELVKDLKGNVDNFGYSSSPLFYDGTVICTVGGPDHGAIAVKIADGSILWKSKPFARTHASPILIRVGSSDQVVCRAQNEMYAVDPKTGDILWQAPAQGSFALTPLFGPDGMLFSGASKTENGAQMVKLFQRDGKTVTQSMWDSRKANYGYWNAVRVGDMIYGSIGQDGNMFAAVDAKTGELKWRQRGFQKANCLWADGKLVFLDENGILALARPTAEKLTILGETKLLDSVSWTVPTIVGTTLYARDKKHIVAVNLGEPSATPPGRG